MKREYKDLTSDEKKEYLLLRETANTSSIVYAIFIAIFIVSLSFNSEGAFLFKWAATGILLDFFLLVIMILLDGHKIRKIFGL